MEKLKELIEHSTLNELIEIKIAVDRKIEDFQKEYDKSYNGYFDDFRKYYRPRPINLEEGRCPKCGLDFGNPDFPGGSVFGGVCSFINCPTGLGGVKC